MKKLLIIALILFTVFLPKILTPFFPYFVQSKLKGNLTIEKTSLSWLGPQKFEELSYKDNGFAIVSSKLSSRVPFWKLASIEKSFELSDASLSYDRAKVTDIEASVDGSTIKAIGQTQGGGTIQVKGSVSKQFDLDFSVQKLPTILIDKLLDLNGILDSTFGNILDAKGTYKNGSIDLNVQSNTSNLELHGQVKEGILTLNDELKARLMLSEENAKLISSKLQIIKPSSFTLNISPRGFACPLKNLKEVRFDRATLDLSKVYVHGNEMLFSLLKIFKSSHLSKQMELWFTPVEFSLIKKRLVLGRFDVLLAQSVHLCGWGDINLNRDKLNMTIGIPKDTLERSFGIQSLGSTYVLQIPVKGSIQNPKFDTGQAVAKIAAMTTAQEIPTTGGKVFGGLFKLIVQSQDEEDAPKPNRPFPWES